MFNFNEMKYLSGIQLNEVFKKPIAWELQREMYHLALTPVEHLSIIMFKDHKPVDKSRKEIATGNLERVEFDIYDIIREAQRNNADEINILHNHPSESSTPSKTDIQAAKEMDKIFADEGITTRYFIIAGGTPKGLTDLKYVEYNGNGII